jgi:hypothetical protein
MTFAKVMSTIAFAALTLSPMSAGTAAAIEQVQTSGTKKIAKASSDRKSHRPVRIYEERQVVYEQPQVYDGPRACSSVVFPRSPLCPPEPYAFLAFPPRLNFSWWPFRY